MTTTEQTPASVGEVVADWLDLAKRIEPEGVVGIVRFVPICRTEIDAIEHLVAEREVLQDKVEGLDADLRCAVQTAYNRGATEWARLNYPNMIEWLKSCGAQPKE